MNDQVPCLLSYVRLSVHTFPLSTNCNCVCNFWSGILSFILYVHILDSSTLRWHQYWPRSVLDPVTPRRPGGWGVDHKHILIWGVGWIKWPNSFDTQQDKKHSIYFELCQCFDRKIKTVFYVTNILCGAKVILKKVTCKAGLHDQSFARFIPLETKYGKDIGITLQLTVLCVSEILWNVLWQCLHFFCWVTMNLCAHGSTLSEHILGKQYLLCCSVHCLQGYMPLDMTVSVLWRLLC